MVSDLATPNVGQRLIIKFLAKKKVKPADILRTLNAQYGKETQSCAGVCGWYSKFSEGTK
jgi:hypothetical protein